MPAAVGVHCRKRRAGRSRGDGTGELAASGRGGSGTARRGADVDVPSEDALAEFPAHRSRARSRVAHRAVVRHGGVGLAERLVLSAGCPATLPVRVLVTGGAGFIGSHFVKRLVAGGDEVVVLDKLTYAGNPANLRRGRVELVVGDIADPDAVAGPAQGCDAIVNFAAETHVDRSILGPQEFVHTDVLGTHDAARVGARRTGARFVQVSTDEVYGDLEAGGRALEDDPLRPSSPYSAAEGGRRPAGARLRAHVRRRRVDHPRREHVRAEPVPREARPALRHERARRRSRSRSTATGSRCASGSTPRTTAPASSSCCARARPGEVYNVGGEDHENIEVTHRILELTGADPSLIRHVEDRAGPRPPLRARRLEAPRARLGAGALVRRDGPPRTVDWYRDEPRVVGADQVRRLPPLLRGAVRRAAAGVTVVRDRIRKPCAASSPSPPSLAAAAAAARRHGAPKLAAPVFVLAGGGWGHGVGMSQWGAYGQAKAGRDYRTILGALLPGHRIGSAPTVASSGARPRR